jgi:hypothetical protein
LVTVSLHMANDIPALQNDDKALHYLASQRRLYGRAKVTGACQIALVVCLPLVLVVVEHFVPTFKVFAAATGLVIAILDVALFANLKTAFQKRAAAIQEVFDCHVFRLDWAILRCEKPDPEDIERLSRGADMTLLRDWYPPQVGALQPDAAIVVCQRSNCRWDSQLRSHYRTALWIFAATVILLIVVVALARNLSSQDVVLVLLAPLLPVVLWAIREASQQKEAIDRADRLKAFGDQLWQSLLNGRLAGEASRLQSRLFQDEIMAHRRQSAPVFDWFYRLFRDSLEAQTRYSASTMIAEATARGLM